MILADEPNRNLGTASSHEIAQMPVEFNKSGRTIVLITDEEDIAAFAERVVRLCDGHIVSDTARHELAEAGA